MERTLAWPSAIFSLMSRSRSRVSLLFLCPCASLASSRLSRSRSLRRSSLQPGHYCEQFPFSAARSAVNVLYREMQQSFSSACPGLLRQDECNFSCLTRAPPHR